MLTARPNAEGAYRQFASKTPGRALSRNENANRGGPATVHGKGKNVLLQTPFNPTTKLLPNDGDKPQPLEYLRQLRPLQDKTPFHNRSKQEFQTPFGPCFDDVQTPDSLLRPSSLRRHVRAPRMSLSAVKTPENTMHPWECDVSVETPDVSTAPVAPVDDHDEIEYMAPNTLDLEYSPPFDFELPDYKEVGMKLRSLVHAPPLYNDEPPPPDPVLDDLGMVSWEGMLELPELESSDPFVVMSKAMKPKSSTTRSTLFPSTSRPPMRARSALATTNKSTTLSRATSRSTIVTSTSGTVTRPVKAPVSRAPRPATAMSTTRSTRAPRPATALSSRAPISRRPVVSKPLERSRSVVGRPKVAEKKKSEDGLAFNVEKSTSEDFLFAV